MGQIFSELGPEGLYCNLDLANGREASSNDFALLLRQFRLKVLDIALEIKFLVGPVAIVHRGNEFLGPGILIWFA